MAAVLRRKTGAERLQIANRFAGARAMLLTHLRDITGVLRTSSDIDNDYIERWSATLGLLDIWHGILKRLHPSP